MADVGPDRNYEAFSLSSEEVDYVDVVAAGSTRGFEAVGPIKDSHCALFHDDWGYSIDYLDECLYVIFVKLVEARGVSQG
jgi:hypothetical protein